MKWQLQVLIGLVLLSFQLCKKLNFNHVLFIVTIIWLTVSHNELFYIDNIVG